jgi:hypothetical protein
MSPMRWLLKSEAVVVRREPEPLSDYRARLRLEEQERAERKRMDQLDQRSSANSPETRVRAWEKVHALRMPVDPNHPILDVIAVATRLTLTEVQEEQRRRALLLQPG